MFIDVPDFIVPMIPDTPIIENDMNKLIVFNSMIYMDQS